MNETLIPTRQAATMLGVSPASLLRLAKLGKVPHVRISDRIVRFKEAALQEILRDSHGSVKVENAVDPR